MNQSKPVITLVSYFPKEGREAALEKLVLGHYPALRATGLVTDTPAKVYKANDKRTKKKYFVEIFEWRDENASSVAHQTPEVMAVWEPMGPEMETMSIVQIEPLG